MFGLGLGRMGLVGDLGFAIRRSLFGDGEQGLWYDLNDDSIIFQDSAGTTLASWGDPVGLMLDKSRWDGRGVVNRLIHTNDVTQAVWASGSNNISRPSVNTIVETVDNVSHFLLQSINVVSGLPYTKTVSLQKGLLASAPDVMQLTFGGSGFGTSQFANVNVSTGAVLSVAGGATCTSAADPLVSGAWRFTYTATATATVSTGGLIVAFCNNNPAAARIVAYIGSILSDCRVYRMQSELGSTATAYQANGASVGGAGNHAIQATAGSRPIRGRMPKRGRVNLLAATQRFDDAYWNKTGTGTGSAPVVTANDAIAPDGTLTADRVDFNRGAGNTGADDSVLRRQAIAVTSATVHNGSFYAKAATGVDVGKQIAFRHVAGGSYLVITLTADWQRVDRAETSFAASVDYQIAARGTITVDNTVSAHLWGAQLEQAATATAYQHVIDSLGFNVTESGQPSCGYLSFNGSNQWMQTAASVNFSATDEMSVFAGVRKVSDAASGVVAGLGDLSGLENGTMSLRAPRTSANATYGYLSRGTSNADAITAGSFAAPINNVVTALSDISADSCIVRANGVQVATSASDQGTGNYGNYTVFFGARSGTSLYFNGLMFSTIIRGALTSGTLLTRTEQYVARQTPTVNL